MLFRIQGHSGCKITVHSADTGSLVRKTSAGPDYDHRLLAQAIKQARFANEIKWTDIVIPTVQQVSSDEAPCFFEMDLFHGHDSISYFGECSIASLDEFCAQITRLIDFEIEKSPSRCFEKQRFLDKFSQVADKLQETRRLDLDSIERCFHALPEDPLPMGFCHGDLTLSNILFSRYGHEICLIDFLDTFYESPIQDMVKLQQDTRYLWSPLLYNHPYDKVRHQMVMRYLDEKLTSHFMRFDFYQTYFAAFQLMNFLRVLQYAQEEATIAFLSDHIQDMVNKWT